jgi:DNA-binding protein Fis
LLKKLDDQETTIEKLQAEKKTLQQAMNDQQKALEDYLANLNVG